MSETEITAPPPPSPEAEPPTQPAPVPAPAPPRRGRTALTLLAALLFVVLFGAVGWLWDRQEQLAESSAAQQAATPEQHAALERRIDSLAQQVAGLLQRPATAAPVDLQPLEARIAALEQHQPGAPVDLAPLEARIAALEQRQPTPPADLGPLEQKLAAAAAAAQAARAAEADVGSRLAALEQRLGAAEQQSAQLAGKAAQAQRVGQAMAALEAGEKLGAIPGAPPALARFADAAPPTEAQLRLSFPEAAAAAVQASRPSAAGKSFGERMWLRARSLVTVRQGDRVLVGAPAAEVLGHAQARLDAGDLAGTLKALEALDGPAAQAMAPWRGQAQALLDARAALAEMARG